MKTKTKPAEKCCPDHSNFFTKGRDHSCNCSSSGAIYGLGIFGALFYFLNNATTFGAVIVGIFKAIFWPAFVIFKVLSLLGL